MTILAAEIDGMRGLADPWASFSDVNLWRIKMLCLHFGRRKFTSRRARSLNQIRLALHLSEFQFR